MRNALAILALSAVPVLAQEDGGTSRRDEILAALDLPASAQSLRDKGVDRAEVKKAMEAAKGKGMKAKETRGLMRDASTAVDEHGPVDNFGAFVKSKLDSGLRGKDLAAAIKAEHAARGKGKGHGKKKEGGTPGAGKAQGGKEKEKKEKEEEAEGCGEEDDAKGGKQGEKPGGKPEKERGGGKPEQGEGKGKGKGK